VVGLAAPAFPTPRTRTVVMEDVLKTEAPKKLGQCQVGSRTDHPCPPPSGNRDSWCPLLRAVRPRARGVLRYRRDVAELRKLGSEKGRSWHMTQGRVLWYCDAIGYGFIQPDEGGGKFSCLAGI
jgi:hypothetical protein